MNTLVLLIIMVGVNFPETPGRIAAAVEFATLTECEGVKAKVHPQNGTKVFCVELPTIELD